MSHKNILTNIQTGGVDKSLIAFPEVKKDVTHILEGNHNYMNSVENDKKWLDFVNEKLRT